MKCKKVIAGLMAGVLASMSLAWVHIQRRHVQHWKKIYRNLLRCSLYSRNVRIRWQDH